MSNFLLEPGIAIYMALAVALAVWLGIFAFLWRLDRQARELRRRLDQRPRAEAAAPRATLERQNAHSQEPVTEIRD
jgi:CcmD family protein